MLIAGKFAWVQHVKLPVKYLWYSGKFTCTRRQCACVLREVLAASKQVNSPRITGKLHVTQVNCARDLFTCELHVKLPAFAGNFARASFTVFFVITLKPLKMPLHLNFMLTAESVNNLDIWKWFSKSMVPFTCQIKSHKFHQLNKWLIF